jgi:hypothetical protein
MKLAHKKKLSLCKVLLRQLCVRHSSCVRTYTNIVLRTWSFHVLLAFVVFESINGTLSGIIAYGFRWMLHWAWFMHALAPLLARIVPSTLLSTRIRASQSDDLTFRLVQPDVCLVMCQMSLRPYFRGVTRDGVWIGEWIYWPLIHTTRNYKQLLRYR